MFHREPYPNEFVSREQMRDMPPHILLTNYAMLEYLLLRPDDHVFFDGEQAGSWRFLVIDEAHTYSGAKGIEMAMLLRRLKDRVVEGERGRLRCVATSATRGGGEKDFPEVARFARQLFGERGAWVAGDPSRQDVIKAARKHMIGRQHRHWKPEPALYPRWQESINQFSGRESITALVAAGKAAGVPDHALQMADMVAGEEYEQFLYEVLKGDEQEISRRYASLAAAEQTRAATSQSVFRADGALKAGVATELSQPDPAAQQAYIRRFIDFFPAGCLHGLKILFYQHSSVSREVLPDILQRLGAKVIRMGLSESFVPVDTEAVQEPERLAAWVRTHGADALVSTDGDGDRPLVVDETGKVVRGDVLGILVSEFLAADSVSTPVSCNTALEKSGRFASISRTRIGSPYVVESMNAAVAAGHKAVVGYEANGGFLTASNLTDPQTGAVLKALPTRDAALPIIAVLRAACQRGMTLSALVATLPPRYTASGLLRGFPNELGKALVARFQASGKDLAGELFSPLFGPVEALDFTDGARITFVSGDIVHLRPSGNAPEFRCYTEASSEQQAVHNNELALQVVEQLKTGM